MDPADAVPIAELLEERRYLLDVAYWMLGSPREAESVVDETYRRWYGLSDAERRQITAPRTWLAKIASEICLSRLTHPERSATGQRQGHRTETGDAEETQARLAEEVSQVLLDALDSLSPAQRAAFVLNDAFGLVPDMVADIVGRPEPECIELASAASAKVRPVATPGTLPHCLKGVGGAPTRRAGRKPKYIQYEDFRPAVPQPSAGGDTQSTHRTPLLNGQTLADAALADRARHCLRMQRSRPTTPEGHDALARAVRQACASEDTELLASLLCPDATAFFDGGGKIRARIRPVHGSRRVAHSLLTLLARRPRTTLTAHSVNGRTGLVARYDDQVAAVISLEVRARRPCRRHSAHAGTVHERSARGALGCQATGRTTSTPSRRAKGNSRLIVASMSSRK
ncbi:hypothetical protein [Streptomyces sp. NPDC050564]|uniref:hypothetical protein n=1 Tax=Streptomyces sp. NPDC050564 TaxID=3365631 RepID=UPI0037A5A899